MKHINSELTLLWGRTSKPLFESSEVLSPGGTPASKSAPSRLRVSLFLLEAKGIGGDGSTDLGQHLGVLRSGPFVQNIQGKMRLVTGNLQKYRGHKRARPKRAFLCWPFSMKSSLFLMLGG